MSVCLDHIMVCIMLTHRIAGKFGMELNLAVWQIVLVRPPNLIPPIAQHSL